MKIVKLDLRAYGAFADRPLDFSAPALHVVYGGNEAGKSTALRAIKTLFYGIPFDTPDAHRVEPSKLRIGALVRDARGRELYVVRRKGNKRTLLDEHGEPLHQSEEAWLTGGTAEPLYGLLFGLSYASLRDGAEALLSGAGELGQSLFGAGVGGAAVHDVLTALAAEADEILRPKGKTQKLNEALSALGHAKEELRNAALPADAFTKQEEAIEVAERETRALREKRLALMTEQERLQRVRRVSPLLAKRGELLRARGELGDAPLLAADTSIQRQAAQEQRRAEALRIQHLRAEIERLSQQRLQLDVPESLVTVEAAVVDDLRDRIGSYKRAQRELPQRRAARERSQEDARRLAQALGRDVAFGEGDRVVVSKVLAARIREHSLLGAANARETEQLDRALMAKQAELARERAQWSALRAPGGASAVVAPLPLLARLALPGQVSIDRFERELGGLEQERAATGEHERELRDASERATLELDALASAGSLPSEEVLMQLRAQRRLHWARLRDLLSDASTAVSAFALGGDGHALLAELEQASDAAEQLADRLRREADRVHAHARLSAELHARERALSRLQDERKELDERFSQLQRAWHDLWKDAGLSPRAPQEMRGFLAQEQALSERCDRLGIEVEQLQQARAEQDARQRAWQEQWSPLTAQLGLPATATVAEANAMLDGLAELAIEQERARSMAREIADQEREAARFEADVRNLWVTHLQASCADVAVELAAENLLERYQRAQHERKQRDGLDASLGARRSELESAEAALRDAERVLQALLHAAGVKDDTALEAAEQRSTRVRELEAQLTATQLELAELSDGATAAELQEEVQGQRLDEVPARIAEIQEQLEELEQERDRVTHQLAGLRAGQDRRRESHEAADAAIEAATHVATIRAYTERYMRLRLARAILEQEIARYRDRHKGPILRAGGELFARLTLGAFTSLDPDYSESDEPVLVCVRPNGERVRVAGLSDGTRDQLYLALRLASVQHLSQQQELMPITLDDILVHFDDDRARAALVLLGELAELTQVLFFTHHSRLVELASDALPASKIVVHELSERDRSRSVQPTA